MQTVIGTVIDPMADKTLMTVVTFALAMEAALPGIVFVSINLRSAVQLIRLSTPRCADTRPGRNLRSHGVLLSLHLAPSSEDDSSILGF